MIGETLGQYRIDAQLGSGGMGVVYRAHDTRLHRTVAIKVVGDEATGSAPDGRARLLDEARAASHLTHPHICTVYEVGEVDGRPFIAMEFVDGRPLGELLPAGGLPTETVVTLGVQIAGALAHAHERGVVHRDLKTANVVVSPEHGVKVLDFGLARRFDPAGHDVVTRSMRDTTGSNTLFGTLAYIAPELLVGKPPDARVDIWALGVVLYEMATGDLPFKGRTEYELTAAILRESPQPFPAHVPAILRSIILRCLTKEPAHRYQRAGEVRAALEAVQSHSPILPAAPDTSVRKPRWSIVAAITAAVLTVAATLGWIATRGRKPLDWSAAGATLTRVVAADQPTFDPALSPDGRMLCYAEEAANGRVDLFIAGVSGSSRVQLTDDDAREAAPKFSPDGASIAFTRLDPASGASEIRIVPALGGNVTASIANASSPAWSPDGRRLAFLGRLQLDGPPELTVANRDGSNRSVLLRSDSRYPFLRHPDWSPDSREIAVVRGSGGIAGEIWFAPAAGGAPRRALEDPPSVFSDSPAYTPDGRGLVYTSNRGGATNIWFLPLPSGEPVRLTTGPGPDESPSIAGTGAIAFVNTRWRNTLSIFDVTSATSRLLVTHTPFLWGPAASPDGKEVAFSRGEVDGSWHVWTVPAEGGTARRITSGESGEVYPRYSPSGDTIFFHTWSAPRRIGRAPAKGGPSTLLPSGGEDGFADVSPDGKELAFTRSDGEAERVYVAGTNGSAPRLLTASPGTVPRWSPDGTLLAFSANRGYTGGIFLIGRDGRGERRLTAEGGWPVWWPDGRRVAYVAIRPDGNQEIRVASLDGGTRTIEGLRFSGSNHPFEVFRDGRRLAVSNAVHVSDEIWLLEPKRGR